jgi:alpha-ribazole phosphatase
MLKLLVIRHGETQSNAERRFSGHQDVELTEKGIWQAEQLSYRLKDEQIDIAYSSDLKRAIHTAKIVLRDRNISLSIEPRFREISFGDWEGLRLAEYASENGEGSLPGWWNQPDSPLSGGESVFDLRKRVKIALDEVITENDEEDKCKTIAIVCHGGVTRMIIGLALDIPIRKIWHIRQQSTALNVIRYDKNSGFFVGSVNDIAHITLQEKKDESIEKF